LRRRDLLLTAAAPACRLLAQPADPAAPARRLAADPQRPQYHLLPPAHWMNDPNGPIFWKGKLHMFYQHNPGGAFHANMHWGHAVSSDLVHWKHLPIALAPTPGGPDKDGVYSGSAIVHDGVPTLFYTGVRPEVQCFATSTDDELVHWKKHEGNPVIDAPPPELAVTGFRDPCLWQKDGVWYMLIGSGFKGVGGACLLYRSKDLVHWDYMHPFFTGKMYPQVKGKGPVATGEMWECPDFFPLGNKYVLIVATKGTTLHFIGDYKDDRFHPLAEGCTDFGCSYAPKTVADPKGRRILWAWIRERRKVDAHRAAGWAGVMSLPRILTLGPRNLLQIQPAAELQKLRARHWRFADLTVPPGAGALLKDAQGDCLEILAEFDPLQAEEVGLKLRCAPDHSEGTEVRFNRATRHLTVDRRNSSRAPDVDLGET